MPKPRHSTPDDTTEAVDALMTSLKHPDKPLFQALLTQWIGFV